MVTGKATERSLIGDGDSHLLAKIESGTHESTRILVMNS